MPHRRLSSAPWF